MAEEPENVLRQLREMREESAAFRQEMASFRQEVTSRLDKLTVEVIGIKGRVRKVEEGMESIARVISEGSNA
jgi:hypothetical protein